MSHIQMCTEEHVSIIGKLF